MTAKGSDQKLLPVASPQQGRPRLLVIQPLVGIGDMVWHKPWIDHLAQSYDVVIATKPTVKADDLFAMSEGVVEILSIERSLRGRKGRHDGVLGFARLIADMRAVKADRAVILHHSSRYGLAAYLAGIPERWGYGIGSAARWLNRGAFLDKSARHQHPTGKMKDFAVMNGFQPNPPVWAIGSPPDAVAGATAFLDENAIPATEPLSPFMTIGVGAMDVERQWPAAHCAKFVQMMRAAFPTIRIGLMGAPSEIHLIDAVRDAVPENADVMPMTMPLNEAISLLGRNLLYVGNDTSLLNIAAACGRPAIGVFAQSKPLDYTHHIKAVSPPDGTYGKPNHIATITADLVFAAVCDELQELGWTPQNTPKPKPTPKRAGRTKSKSAT